MTDFTEISLTKDEQDQALLADEKYKYVGPLDLITDFYRLWGRVEMGDFQAYTSMLSGFPAEWMSLAPPSWFICDEECIPEEFILYPDGVEDAEERYAARMVLVPDQYAISAWLSNDLAK